jgi:hypothetical protein
MVARSWCVSTKMLHFGRAELHAGMLATLAFTGIIGGACLL